MFRVVPAKIYMLFRLSCAQVIVMKAIKMIGILLVFALFSGVGLAQEIEEEDIEEAGIIGNPLGAEVRMLQLEKAIERQIVSGEIIIERILEYNETTDIEKLNATLEEIRNLLEIVQNYDFNQGLNESELAADFVELKVQARDLTRIFREEAREMTDQDIQERIREGVHERVREMKEEHKQELQEIKNRYNKRVMEHVMNRTGINNTEAMENIRNGRMGPEEFKGMLRREMAQANPEKREEILARIRETNSETEVALQQVKERVRQKTQLIEERLENKMTKVQEKLNNLPAKGGPFSDNETPGNQGDNNKGRGGRE